MKKTDMERKLNNAGFSLIRNGSNHDIWKKGDVEISVPRHREINEITAKTS